MSPDGDDRPETVRAAPERTAPDRTAPERTAPERNWGTGTDSGARNRSGRSELLVDRGRSGVPLDRFDAVEGAGLARVALTARRDDLPVAGLQTPAVLPLAVFVQLKLRHLPALRTSALPRCAAMPRVNIMRTKCRGPSPDLRR